MIVGADRIAANGDVANKIGTYSVAVLANANQVPFYVAAPDFSTIDLSLQDGSKIPIEERSAKEVVEFNGKPTAPEGIAVRHPAFDVTPNELVTAIITDKGIARLVYRKISASYSRRNNPDTTKMIVLGIETSCDDTSVAVLKEDRILSNVVSSQVKVHESSAELCPNWHRVITWTTWRSFGSLRKHYANPG